MANGARVQGRGQQQQQQKQRQQYARVHDRQPTVELAAGNVVVQALHLPLAHLGWQACECGVEAAAVRARWKRANASWVEAARR